MTQSIPLGSDARERFLLEIAAVVPPHRVSEVHFFAPLRQGPMETGVAVIAATPEGAEAPSSGEEVSVTEVSSSSESSAGAESSSNAESSAGAQTLTDIPVSEIPVGSAEVITGGTPEAEASAPPEFPEGARISSRHVVYSARYRWTRKGPERGKWESEIVAEADAPLLTVETVVQGVTRRSAEPLEVEKLDGDTVRALIAKAQQRWPTTP